MKNNRKFKIKVERLPVYAPQGYCPSYKVTEKIIEFTEYKNVCRFNKKSAGFNQDLFLREWNKYHGDLWRTVEFTSGGGPTRPVRYLLLQIIEEIK